MAVKTNLGRVGLVPQGSYDARRTYARLDMVTWDGASYVALRDLSPGGDPPDRSDAWQLLSARGEAGPQGPVGPLAEIPPIGGANLLRDSAGARDIRASHASGSAYFWRESWALAVDASLRAPLRAGGTVSVALSADAPRTVSMGFLILPASRAGEAISATARRQVALTATPQRFTFPVPAPSTAENPADPWQLILTPSADAAEDEVIHLGYIQLESGGAATDWAPCPDDAHAFAARSALELPRFSEPSGADLEQVFAEEIKGHENVWQWLKARAAAGDWRGVHVGDYVRFKTLNNLTFQAVVAGVDTYYGYGDTPVGHHIDFITNELWDARRQMNVANFNNGASAEEKSPWICSNGNAFINSLTRLVPRSNNASPDMGQVNYNGGGVHAHLPAALRAAITPKRVLAPTRFGTSLLTENNGSAWISLGPLWLPFIHEVTGDSLWGGEHEARGLQQYPLFAGRLSRVRYDAPSGSPMGWWTASATGTHQFLYVRKDGVIDKLEAAGTLAFVICFRIGGE